MTLGRRSFLGLFGGAAGARVALSFARVDDPILSFPRLGLDVRRPDDWCWLTRLDYEIAKETYRVPGGEAEKEAVTSLAGIPLCACAEDLGTNVPSPTIVVWAEPRRLKRDIPYPILHQATYERYGKRLADFGFESPSVRYVVQGHEGSRCVVRFTELDAIRDPAPLRLQSTMFSHGGNWVTFNFVDLQTEWTDATQELFEEFENSMRLY